MKIHLPPAAAIRINELLIAQQIGADLGDPMHLRVSRNNVSQQ